jgi:hypothetical protein
MLIYNVDPINGDDLASGGASDPWKTWDKVRRTTNGLYVPGGLTLNAMNDAPDSDPLLLNVDTLGGLLVIQGSAPVAATVTLTSDVPRNWPANQLNEVGVTGFDWAPHVGRYVRSAGASTDTAVILKNLGSGVARLGVRLANPAGFATGNVLEVVTNTKISSLFVKGDVSQLRTRNIAFDATTVPVLVMTPPGCNFNPARCTFGGVSSLVANLYADSCAGSGNVWTRSSWACRTLNGLASDRSGFIDMAGQGLLTRGNILSRDAVFQNARQLADAGPVMFQYLGTLGIFDLAAGITGVQLGAGNRFSVQSGLYGTGDLTSTCLSIAPDTYSTLSGFGSTWAGGTPWQYLGVGHSWTDVPFFDPAHGVVFQNG